MEVPGYLATSQSRLPFRNNLLPSSLFLQGLTQHKQIPQSLSIKVWLTPFLSRERDHVFWHMGPFPHIYVPSMMNEHSGFR